MKKERLPRKIKKMMKNIIIGRYGDDVRNTLIENLIYEPVILQRYFMKLLELKPLSLGKFDRDNSNDKWLADLEKGAKRCWMYKGRMFDEGSDEFKSLLLVEGLKEENSDNLLGLVAQ